MAATHSNLIDVRCFYDEDEDLFVCLDEEGGFIPVVVVTNALITEDALQFLITEDGLQFLITET